MPLYEYQCEACAHRFEAIQKFSDAPLETCPQCAGAVRKLLSSPAFHFKGSGWYITDYARAGKGGAEASGDGAGSGKSTPAAGEAKGDAQGGTAGTSKSEKSESTAASKDDSKPPSTPSTSD